MNELQLTKSICAVLGGALMLASSGFFRRAPTWNIREWKPIWKQRELFSPWGWRLFVAGITLLGCSVALAIVDWIV